MTDGRNGYIQLEGLDEVLKAFDMSKEDVRKAAKEAVQTTGGQIIAEAQRNLRANQSVVTNVLRQSGHVQQAPDGMSADVGFFDTTNRNSGYALYVEYGRRAGKFPPVDEIAQWVYKKFGFKPAQRDEADRIGFLIARRIAKQGTEPHPFFAPAVEAKIRNFEKNMKAILSRKQTFR